MVIFRISRTVTWFIHDRCFVTGIIGKISESVLSIRKYSMSCERKLTRNTIFLFPRLKSGHVHARRHIEAVSVDGLSLDLAGSSAFPYAYVIAGDTLARRTLMYRPAVHRRFSRGTLRPICHAIQNYHFSPTYLSFVWAQLPAKKLQWNIEYSQTYYPNVLLCETFY